MSRRVYKHTMDALIGKPIYYGVNATTQIADVYNPHNPTKDEGAGGFYIPNTEVRRETFSDEPPTPVVPIIPIIAPTPTPIGVDLFDETKPVFVRPPYVAPEETKPVFVRPPYVAPEETKPVFVRPPYVAPEETKPVFVRPPYVAPEETKPVFVRPPYVAPAPAPATTPIVPIIPIIVPVSAPTSTPYSGGGSGGSRGGSGGGSDGASMPSNSALAPSVAIEKSFLRRNILPIILVAVATYIFIKKPIK